jgi:LCP family protein required for cell wall assembly
LEGRKPLFILALGSDARPGQDIEHQRADSIHIIGIDPAGDRATILGFPRDSWVPIPGVGTNKINTAMTFGGPPLLVKTIENLTGIPIDFWMLTSFPGVVNMVNGIGGLTLNIPQRLHDRYSGAFLSKGVHHLNGAQALAFSRDRHDFVSGDLSRSYDQGEVLISALEGLHKAIQRDPTSLITWMALGWRNVFTDLPVETLIGLALAATQVPVARVNNMIVPTAGGMVGAVDVEFVLPSAQSIFADMRGDGVVGR